MRRGEKVGLLKVRLYRPFSVKHFLEALPATVRKIAVLDRTKEAGAAGEPLYLDVVNAIHEGLKHGYGQLRTLPRSSWAGATDCPPRNSLRRWSRPSTTTSNQAEPKDHFTVGIHDDVGHTSLDYDPAFSTEPDSVVRAMFYGLGADGTVGANKNSIKIIGENTDNYAQGYFVYDSKKSGAMTVSHLRFGPQPIRSTLSGFEGQLRRLPSVDLPRALRHAQRAGPWRHVPAQQPLRPRRSLGPPAAPGAAAADRTRRPSST